MNDSLKRDTPSIVTVDPFRCRLWEMNGRIKAYVNETSCHAEIESIAREGQLVPVLGRPVHGTPDFDIEVICGARRLFVTRYLNIPLRVELRELTDRQAAVAVEMENSLRRKTSPYERGLWFSKLLKQNLYQSQDEMARELGITPTQVTRLLKFADLPEAIIDAFASPHDILESWAVELHKASCDERHRLLAERASKLGMIVPRPPAVSVYETLFAARKPGLRAARSMSHRIVKSPSGAPLLRVDRLRKHVVLRIPNSLIDMTTEKEVVEAVVSTLTRYRSVNPAQDVA